MKNLTNISISTIVSLIVIGIGSTYLNAEEIIPCDNKIRKEKASIEKIKYVYLSEKFVNALNSKINSIPLSKKNAVIKKLIANLDSKIKNFKGNQKAVDKLIEIRRIVLEMTQENPNPIYNAKSATNPVPGMPYLNEDRLVRSGKNSQIYLLQGNCARMVSYPIGKELFGPNWLNLVNSLDSDFFEKNITICPETLTFMNYISKQDELNMIFSGSNGNSIIKTNDTIAPTNIGNSNPPRIGSCQIFPSDNPWNKDISNSKVHPNSQNFINSIGLNGHLHADFGGLGTYGIPFITVGENTPKIPLNFTAYGDESDTGPYPIPLDAPIEGGTKSIGDRHVLAVDKDNCMLYELYRGVPQGNSWNADSAAKFDLKSNDLRPAGWTSADAAGLPIFPGLARYDEVASGMMNHALRFTVSKTQKSYIYPARHFASNSSDKNLPPMGLRLRLKSDYDISKFTGQSKIILNTLKKYGMMVADNGSNWFITGDANPGWNDEDLNQLKTVPGSAFEVIEP